jgi:hypothetical protein
MEAGLRTPMLDFFRRGEVARDIRLLAAQGAIAPRPVEQLGLLMLLTSDSDTEIRDIAEATLQMLPRELVAGFIARADTPTDLREFFIARGIEPGAAPAPDEDMPILDTDQTVVEGSEDEDAVSVAARVSELSVPQKIRAAMKGSREMRSLLIRDPNRIVAFAVLSCPKVSEQEVETFSRMTNISSDILRTIGQTRAWMKNYSILSSIVKNPKTPVASSLTLMHRLNDRDVRNLSTDRNVPEPLRIAARKKVAQNQP